eukprot:6184300-Pleurochrysis_carterae.AAC.7
MPPPVGWGLLSFWESWVPAEATYICTLDEIAPICIGSLAKQQSFFDLQTDNYPAMPTIGRSLDAIALVASVRNVIRLQRALQYQSSLSARLQTGWAGHRPNWICLLASLTSYCNVFLFLLRVIHPEMMIGKEVLPSLIYGASRAFLFFTGSTDIIHFLDVSMTLQESAQEKEQVQESLVTEHLLYLIPTVHGCVECIPLSIAASSLSENCSSICSQKMGIFVFLLGNAFCVTTGGMWFVLRAKQMRRSLDACIDTLKVWPVTYPLSMHSGGGESQPTHLGNFCALAACV